MHSSKKKYNRREEEYPTTLWFGLQPFTGVVMTFAIPSFTLVYHMWRTQTNATTVCHVGTPLNKLKPPNITVLICVKGCNTGYSPSPTITLDSRHVLCNRAEAV